MLEQSIYIDGLKINYKIGGVGVPILVLHGWGSSSDKWQKVGELLIKNNFQVIVPDLPGFGKSDFPPKPWSVGDYLEFIVDLTKKLELNKFFLFGHSFGGRIAIKYGAVYPEKIFGIILCAAAGIPQKNKTKTKLFYFLAKIGNSIFSKPFFNKFQNFVKKILYKMADTKDYLQASPLMKETMKKVIAEDLTPFLAEIKSKTLIIWGEKDKTLSLSDAYLMKERISNSDLEIIPNIGHSPNLECPEMLTSRIINWLKAIA